MPTERRSSKIAGLCLAAALAGASLTQPAHGEPSSAAKGAGSLIELNALWEALERWWAASMAEPAVQNQETPPSSPESNVRPDIDPSG